MSMYLVMILAWIQIPKIGKMGNFGFVVFLLLTFYTVKKTSRYIYMQKLKGVC